MKNNNTNPIKLARELCFSIYDSMEYKAFKKAEEDILNNNIVIHEIQSNEEVEVLIHNYFQAKKDYDKLLSSIYDIIEYMTGKFKLKNLDKGCCDKCHSNCSNCAK